MSGAPAVRRDGVDAVVGNTLIEVKRNVAALRSVREGLVQLAYAMADKPSSRGFLVLPEVTIARERLFEEWVRAAAVLRPDFERRLTICLESNQGFIGIPSDPEGGVQRILSEVVAEQSHESRHSSRGDSGFVILKVLIHHWLTNGEAVTTNWLTSTTGYSYPTVAQALSSLGSLIERGAGRRIRLRWFPREQFARLVAVSDQVRATVRFADRSAKPRSLEAHLRRLEAMKPPNVAIGGVLGAAHYFPHLDVAGSPRLDLEQHVQGREQDLSFIEKLDPALKRVDDPLEPAMVVVHQVRHADPLFESRQGGLPWADRVECLLDLHALQLNAQAAEFLRFLEAGRAGRA